MTLKHLLPLALAGLITSAAADIRLWLSADYEREMEAEFISAEGDMATINRNGHILTFKQSRLSEEDRAWIKNFLTPLDPPQKVAPTDFAASDFGKALAKTKILKDGTFTDHPLPVQPDLFILYYSASW
ncbi:MAG: hypothetical protein ACSHYF_04930 [Verrucomicrobiaceae bacterium]